MCPGRELNWDLFVHGLMLNHQAHQSDGRESFDNSSCQNEKTYLEASRKHSDHLYWSDYDAELFTLKCSEAPWCCTYNTVQTPSQHQDPRAGAWCPDPRQCQVEENSPQMLKVERQSWLP